MLSLFISSITLPLYASDDPFELVVQSGHQSEIRAAEFSENGEYLLTGSTDKTAKIWDVSAGLEIRTLQGHVGPVVSVAFSRDSQYAFTGSADGSAKMWDVNSGQEIRRFGRNWEEAQGFFPDETGHASGVRSIAVSPDGSVLATVGDNAIIIWDVETGEELDRTNFQEGSTTDLTGVDNVGAALTKGVASTLLKFALKGGDEVPVGVAFSPTESRFVTVGAAKHGVIWSAERGLISSSKKMKNRDKLKIKERAPSWSVTYSPDGKFIAVGGTTGTVSIFKAKNGKRVDSIEAHNAPVTDVSFSADGSQLASSSHDGTVHHWDLSSGKTQRFQGEGKLWTVAFSRTGGSDVVLGAGTDGIARVWEAGTGAEIRQFRAQVQPISSIEIDASGRRIAMASPSGSSIKVWNLDTGLDVQIIDAEAQVNALAFTPDGSKIAAANTDMKARVFDVASGARVGLLSGHVAGSPSVFSMESGENIVGFMMGVTGMGVSGAEMVGMSKFQTNTPEDGVLHITFVDGGTRLVTGGEDETIRVWD